MKLQNYCASLSHYQRLTTREVSVGGLNIGNFNPIRIQTMTTTDTMDTAATVAQTIRCIEAGAELVRITAPGRNEAENLVNIKAELNKRGYTVPLVADIHYTPNAAEIAARIVEKVRINPGNYIDKKKFDFIDYTDGEYAAEVDKIRNRFLPLVRICKEHGTAMRIGTNHGSLSDRIMSRFGDSPAGMVESALEFLRIARDENYHAIILSMKSSNPIVMIQAYRLLVQKMNEEFGECYPLHLGVTEAGDGEDGRIKSAFGIGSLLEDGLGDTVRVSLTEDPEFEIPVCKDLVRKYNAVGASVASHPTAPEADVHLPYNPIAYHRRTSVEVPGTGIGTPRVPVVVADLSATAQITREALKSVGYTYLPETDKWWMADTAADFLYCGTRLPDFDLPGTLKLIGDVDADVHGHSSAGYHYITADHFLNGKSPVGKTVFVGIDVAAGPGGDNLFQALAYHPSAIPVVYCSSGFVTAPIRAFYRKLEAFGVRNPVILQPSSRADTVDGQLIDLATDAGSLLADGFGDGLWLRNTGMHIENVKVSGRTYLETGDMARFLNNTAFSILQAARTRISKTEYISCPSCGRTLFDLQTTTAKIRNATQHLKGVKIAVMGCIVNGPGEMADADFGYVGSGPDKITLYKGKDVVKKNVPSAVAVEELITVLKVGGVWIEPGIEN